MNRLKELGLLTVLVEPETKGDARIEQLLDSI